MEVLRLVRSVKNSFASINLIPPEVLSHIPDHLDKYNTDRDLIALTHVCRRWRTIFISRPSLWSHLDCPNIDKTRAYIERSKAAPLEISLQDMHGKSYTREAFLLAAPDIDRLRRMTIFMTDIPDDILTSHFFCRAPLLKELDIANFGAHFRFPSNAFLDGDLSLLRDLRLTEVITHLPWKNLSSLTTFYLCAIPEDRISVTQLLNFFENAPLLHTISFEYSIPDSSDASPGRVVSLPSLKTLAITAYLPHSTLLNHLSIPSGASLVLEFEFSGDTFPILDHLPRPSENIKILSHVTAINLLFEATWKCLRLGGPNGEIYVMAYHRSYRYDPLYAVDCQILRSLDQSIPSTTKRLAISKLKLPPLPVNNSQVFQTLSSMNELRSLTLTECHNLPLIRALNPNENASNIVICPKLKDLVFYIRERDWLLITEVLNMTKKRASRDMKLSSITFVGLGGLVLEEELKLREYVGRVDYRVDEAPPKWDDHPVRAVMRASR